MKKLNLSKETVYLLTNESTKWVMGGMMEEGDYMGKASSKPGCKTYTCAPPPPTYTC